MTQATQHRACQNVFCGIAGWSYPDWDGYVYPASTRDKLRYVAAYFDVIEINSTFYRPPDPRTVASWLERTRDLPEFHFTAKIHQDVTHRGRIEPATVMAFRNSFAPMVAAGRLRHLLAQFKHDFADAADTRRHLEQVADAFGGMGTLTLELRHRSWQESDVRPFLAELGVTVANLDYPLAKTSFDLPATGIGEHAYLRLHGRNAAAWFSRGAGRDESYNYLYSPQELDAIAQRAREIATLSKSLTLIANNHYRGKEAANALEAKALLQARRVPVPPLLLKHYPTLKAIAAPERQVNDLFG
ncbi:MAG: DUF72 domain-containing protein [Verrucomicrobia bacterium]|nr:DUF72 domain-containing protein [Verrucomicrobiota bacterium]